MVRRVVAAISVGVTVAALAAPAASAGSTAPRVLHRPVASGQWVPAGRMDGRIIARLKDGRVLLCSTGSGGSAAWLYLPHQDRWIRTGDLKRPGGCFSGSAVPLEDGRVLLVGGIRPGAARRLRATQVYDPTTGRWTLTGRLHEARSDAGIAPLPGAGVLVVGGYGPHGANPIATTEVYDPQTGHWRTGLPMAKHRGLPSVAVLPDRDVLVVGGEGGVHTSERFDVRMPRWMPPVRLSSADLGGSVAAYASKLAVLPNGRVLAVGLGRNARQVRVYRSSDDRWIARQRLPREWGYGAMAELSGLPFVIGGFGHRSGCHAATFVYRPAADRWVSGVRMPMPRCSFSAVSLRDGSVLVAGGVIDNPIVSTHPARQAIRFVRR
jgi:hypothetical protein